MNTNHPIATQEVAEILSTMVMNEHGTGEAILNDADFDYVINILEGAGDLQKNTPFRGCTERRKNAFSTRRAQKTI